MCSLFDSLKSPLNIFSNTGLTDSKIYLLADIF
uniref:Uncharacterized protein n=1 Tax=Lepeophtheirus salmonis TaxID=72036 RepID=A0A0K2VFV9_LEPSM